MKRTSVTLLVVLALLLAIPLNSYARYGHRGHHGHHGHTRVFIGGSFWFGPPYWGPPAWGPGYYYPGPAYYGPHPMIVQQPPVYVQRGREESDYWYYCDNPQGYYPYVKSCPGGWMKVVPEAVPPDR
jgi:hypothetical protein